MSSCPVQKSSNRSSAGRALGAQLHDYHAPAAKRHFETLKLVQLLGLDGEGQEVERNEC